VEVVAVLSAQTDKANQGSHTGYPLRAGHTVDQVTFLVVLVVVLVPYALCGPVFTGASHQQIQAT
jgi:hypothetical protein